MYPHPRGEVPEKRSKQKDLRKDATNDLARGGGIVQFGLPDPAQAFLLTAGGRDLERIRDMRPFYETLQKPEKKDGHGSVRDDNAEKVGNTQTLDPDPWDKDKDEYRDQRVGDTDHKSSPDVSSQKGSQNAHCVKSLGSPPLYVNREVGDLIFRYCFWP